MALIISSKKIELVVLTSLIGVYLFFATKDITFPGVNFDEAFPATGTLDLLTKKDISYLYSTDLTFFGKRFPLMISDYYAALITYLLLPFFILFGINVFSLRIAPITFGLLTLIFTYIFAKKFFNKKTAMIAMVLLVTSPSFIFSTKIGNYFMAYSLFFSIAAIFCFFEWYDTGSLLYFILGVFLLGMGLSTAIWFSVLIISIAILALIFRKDIKSRAESFRIKLPWLYLSGVVFFLLGNFLYLYANFINKSTMFITFKCIFERFRNTPSNVDNLNYLNNLFTRFNNLLNLVSEKDLINEVFTFKESNNFFPFVFFISYLWLAFSIFLRKNMYFEKKKILFILLLICIMFAVSPFTLTRLSSLHLLIFIPYIQLSTSVGLIDFGQCFRKKTMQRISKGLIILVVLVLVGFNLKLLKDFYDQIKRLDVHPVWSDVVYELTHWIKEDRPSNVVALTWGFSRNIYLLSQGKIYVYDIHSSPSLKFDEEGLEKALKSFFSDKKTIYIVNIDWPDQRTYMFFKRMINTTGRMLIEEKTFYQRDGRPIYIVYSVR